MKKCKGTPQASDNSENKAPCRKQNKGKICNPLSKGKY